MSKAGEPVLSINLGERNGGVFNFHSPEEIQQWYECEQQHFGWAEKAAGSNGHSQKISNFIRDKLHQIRSEIRQLPDPASNDWSPRASAFKQATEERYKKSSKYPTHLIHSRSVFCHFVDQLRESDPAVALFSLGYFCGLGVSEGNTESARGGFEAFLFDKGLLSGVDCERKALEEMRGEWRAVADECKQARIDIQAQYEALRKQAKDTIAAQKKGHDEVIAQGKSELEALTRAYDEHMALKAPVGYWRGQQSEHGDKVKSLVKVTCSVAAGGVLLIGLAAFYLLDVNKPPWQYVGVLALCSTVFFWVLAILVRMLMSHVHLETDAAERVVMAQTYFALTRDGEETLEQKDRELILQVLFRPSATGIVKDDPRPLIAELLGAMTRR